MDSFAVVFGKCAVKHAQLTTKLYRGMGSELVFSSRHWAVALNYPCGFGAVCPLLQARLGEGGTRLVTGHTAILCHPGIENLPDA